MIGCDRIKEHISDYLEKRLIPQSKKEFEFHISDCSDCRLIVEQIPHIKSRLFNLNVIQCADNFNLKLRQRLSSDHNKPFLSTENVKRLSYGFSFAAVIFLMFFGINMFTDVDSGTNNPVLQVQNKDINTTPAKSNQFVNHAKNHFRSTEELEVKTKYSENSYSDSTKGRRQEEKNPRVKYVDTNK